MSFPEKESLWVLEQFTKIQKAVYNDACDYGIILRKDPNDMIRIQIREALKNLIKFYKFSGIKEKNHLLIN